VKRVHIGLDYFDGTINRIAAWTIGTRNMQKALLAALLMPQKKLAALEKQFRGTEKLALLEECKQLPMGAVYDYFCETEGVPAGIGFMDEVAAYEKKVLSKR